MIHISGSQSVVQELVASVTLGNPTPDLLNQKLWDGARPSGNSDAHTSLRITDGSLGGVEWGEGQFRNKCLSN